MPSVTRDGVSTWYASSGTGSPVVLLHSFLCSGEMWREQVPALSREHQVLKVDFRGHGRSGPSDAPLSLSDLVADVCGVLDDAGVDRAVWVGLSVGGMVSLRAALHASERVRGLVLVDTDGSAERWWIRAKYHGLGMLARRVGLRPLRGQVARQMFGATTRRTRPELVREWSGRFEEIHLPTALNMLESIVSREDLTPRLPALDVPTLVLVGSEDGSLPPERSRRLAASIRGAQLQEIPLAGHLSALEQPEKVTASLLGFLRSLS